MFKKGDSVKIKAGVLIADLEEYDLKNWQGRIVEFIKDDAKEWLLKIEWDSLTLDGMPHEYISKNLEEGYDIDTFILSIDEVEKTKARDSPKARIEAINRIKEEFEVDELEEDEEDEFDEDDEFFVEVLGTRKIEVNKSNLRKYLAFLKEELTFPCILTGIESMGDFSWEEKYDFGFGRKNEYEDLRKTNPSYRDHYELFEFLESEIKEYGTIPVKVRRLSDNKTFILCLDGLEAVDQKSNNYSVLDAFVTWFVNY